MAFPQPYVSHAHPFSPSINPSIHPSSATINLNLSKKKMNSILAVLIMATMISICSGEEELGVLRLGFRGRRVGGRTEVKDVRTNEEVQGLGRFSVEEYNKNLIIAQHNHNNNNKINNDAAAMSSSSSPLTTTESEVLEFRRVVAADRQVVSGIKYYLRIEAVKNEGSVRVFDAVVVVKPWVRPSKQLLAFSPSSSSSVLLSN